MSKNIVIQEGGTPYQFTAKKLKTDKVGGGSVLWVPEDEVSLGTKSISQNGTYKASDDGKYGFSQVTVNVSGSQGSVNPDGTPNVNPVNPNDPDSKVNPGGPGTSVVGTDPVTGNDYVIGVDEDGQLVTTPVPSVIEIMENPTKTDYSDGDTVDPSGLVAVLKNNDGTVFTNEDYPEGTIPISELLIPSQQIDASEAEQIGATSELNTSLVQPITITASGTVLADKINEWTPETYIDLPCLLFWDGNNSGRFESYCAIAFSSSPGSVYLKYKDSDSHGGGGTLYAYTYNDKTVYFRLFGPTMGMSGEVKAEPSNIVDMQYSNNIAQSAWTALYGNSTGGVQEIPVQWKSPYDGRVLDTSYQVTVDGSGFSDDSGGSESGGGTNIPGGGSSSDSGGSASGGGGNF